MWRMCSVNNRRQPENERSEFQAAFIWEQIAISVRCGYAMFNNGAWQATHPTCVVLTLRFHPEIALQQRAGAPFSAATAAGARWDFAGIHGGDFLVTAAALVAR